jgi:hypothetical protein
MTRIIVFPLNVMLFGLGAVLIVKAPLANVGERQQPERLGAHDVRAVPNLV